MFEVIIKQPKLKMKFNLKGTGNVEEVPVNGVVFEFADENVYLNGFIASKGENQSLDGLIKENLKVIKMIDVSKIEDENVKKHILNVNKTKTSAAKLVENAKFTTKVIKLALGEVEQVQFYIDLKTHLLILGLRLHKEVEKGKVALMDQNIQIVIDAINSIKM